MNNMIQIAGIKDVAEAHLLVHQGVTHLGFTHRLSVHAEDTTEEHSKTIIAALPAQVHKILICYLDKADDIAQLADYLGTDGVQIHGDITPAELKKLNHIRPQLKRIKSLIVTNNNGPVLFETVKALSPSVDYFITDTYDPATGATGATGKTHNWTISAQLVRLSAKPVILAGGLNPHNVATAITTVRPFGVDAHSGVEDQQGRKDPRLVKQFVDNAVHAFKRLS